MLRAARTPALSKYVGKEEVGHGGMATVYRAHDGRLGRDVAVKVLHPHLRGSSEIAHRFSVEAKAVAKLRHPNIVEVYDVSSADEDEQYLVVEFLRGVTLRRLLAELGPLPPEIAAILGLELARALAHAHGEGVIHRDVKPENVIIEHRALRCWGARAGDAPVSNPTSLEGNEAVRVKLTDFGIAKLIDAQGVTSTGQVLGSPAHMAPEQIEGNDVDERADVFGLGVLLYEAMVGHLPFEGSNPAQVLHRVLDGQFPCPERERPAVGRQWSDLLSKCIAREPQQRFANMSAVCDAINALLDTLRDAKDVAEPLFAEDGIRELSRYFDDPSVYERAFERRLVPRLRSLGQHARRHKDVRDAAAYFNRALAYVPQDQELLRIVSRLNREKERSLFLRRTVPPALMVLLLGASAFALVRSLRPSAVVLKPIPSGELPVSGSASVPSPTSKDSALAVVPTVPTQRPKEGPTVTTARPEKDKKGPTRREISLAQVKPYGVKVALDGQPLGEAVSGMQIIVDDKAHELFFTCAEDACEVQKRSIPPGDRADAFTIEMRIKDATLVVQGPGDKRYGVREHPGLEFRDRIRVPMKSGVERVTVTELESGKTQAVYLRAGRSAEVSFKAE
jgi:serine/threonine-protein kinase